MPDTDLVLWSAGIGILSSMAASGLFLFVLSRFRPKIDLSPTICRTTGDDGKPLYYVKLVNRTWWPVVNVRFLMTFATTKNVPGGPVSGGPIFFHERIELRANDVLEIPKLDSKDNDHRYALRLRIATNLDDEWQNDGMVHIRFQVYATHSLTGFGKVFERKYYGKNTTLKNGTFQRGRSFEIV